MDRDHKDEINQQMKDADVRRRLRDSNDTESAPRGNWPPRILAVIRFHLDDVGRGAGYSWLRGIDRVRDNDRRRPYRHNKRSLETGSCPRFRRIGQLPRFGRM